MSRIDDCESRIREVEKYISILEVKPEEKDKPLHAPPQGAELPDPPYDIDNLSFPQLLTLADKVNRSHSPCYSRCGECISDRHNFTGRVANENCRNIQLEINILIAKGIIENWNDIEELMSGEKSRTKKSETKSPKCSCSSCEFLKDVQGYRFCMAWHNFTEENGYCYHYKPLF